MTDEQVDKIIALLGRIATALEKPALRRPSAMDAAILNAERQYRLAMWAAEHGPESAVQRFSGLSSDTVTYYCGICGQRHKNGYGCPNQGMHNVGAQNS